MKHKWFRIISDNELFIILMLKTNYLSKFWFKINTCSKRHLTQTHVKLAFVWHIIYINGLCQSFELQLFNTLKLQTRHVLLKKYNNSTVSAMPRSFLHYHPTQWIVFNLKYVQPFWIVFWNQSFQDGIMINSTTFKFVEPTYEYIRL